MHFPPRCPGRRNGLGRPGWNGPHRRRAAPMRQACGRPAARRQSGVFWRNSR
ncbi:uncharacterized protein BCN122_I1158 [Burkholderia cenocepacia]|nr:uncharacterized protein BCN122_I1158 [Burkholderia cenocepacia]